MKIMKYLCVLIGFIYESLAQHCAMNEFLPWQIGGQVGYTRHNTLDLYVDDMNAKFVEAVSSQSSDILENSNIGDYSGLYGSTFSIL